MIPNRSVTEERYAAWLVRQQQVGITFATDRRRWLDHIRDVVITHAASDHTELHESSFTGCGGCGDDHAETLLTDLNRNLTT